MLSEHTANKGQRPKSPTVYRPAFVLACSVGQQVFCPAINKNALHNSPRATQLTHGCLGSTRLRPLHAGLKCAWSGGNTTKTRQLRSKSTFVGRKTTLHQTISERILNVIPQTTKQQEARGTSSLLQSFTPQRLGKSSKHELERATDHCTTNNSFFEYPQIWMLGSINDMGISREPGGFTTTPPKQAHKGKRAHKILKAQKKKNTAFNSLLLHVHATSGLRPPTSLVLAQPSPFYTAVLLLPLRLQCEPPPLPPRHDRRPCCAMLLASCAPAALCPATPAAKLQAAPPRARQHKRSKCLVRQHQSRSPPP